MFSSDASEAAATTGTEMAITGTETTVMAMETEMATAGITVEAGVFQRSFLEKLILHDAHGRGVRRHRMTGLLQRFE